nr:hypothetical protein [Ruegeria arenilitoris]
MKRYSASNELVTDRIVSYRAAHGELGVTKKRKAGRWLNRRIENSHLSFRRTKRAIQRFRGTRMGGGDRKVPILKFSLLKTVPPSGSPSPFVSGSRRDLAVIGSTELPSVSMEISSIEKAKIPLMLEPNSGSSSMILIFSSAEYFCRSAWFRVFSHLHSLAVTMSQKPFLIKSTKTVPLVLTSDTICRKQTSRLRSDDMCPGEASSVSFD